jgi:hypothetical protein
MVRATSLLLVLTVVFIRWWTLPSSSRLGDHESLVKDALSAGKQGIVDLQ